MTTWVRRLLYANIAVFFLQMTTGDAFTGLFDFVPALILIRPWTIVTYMFLHGSITHILFNMLGLYFFGQRVEQRLGASRFLPSSPTKNIKVVESIAHCPPVLTLAKKIICIC